LHITKKHRASFAYLITCSTSERLFDGARTSQTLAYAWALLLLWYRLWRFPNVYQKMLSLLLWILLHLQAWGVVLKKCWHPRAAWIFLSTMLV